MQIDYFIPMVKRETFSGGRKRHNMAPLFPSYVFFCGDGADRYEALRTNRVCQVILAEDKEQFIDELVAIEKALSCPVQLDLYPFARVGQRCRVIKGPMRGVEGSIIKDDDVTRLVLHVSMLSRGASLEINADFLEPIDAIPDPNLETRLRSWQ